MKMMRSLFVRLVKEESGSELIEYALVLGLIVVATVAAISMVGNSVAARWQSVSDGL
jgi:Flp pilus assembly pilin Flp